MEVLLKKKVESLGEIDEIITVKNGYGRNYLIPNGIAILATESIKKIHAENLKQRAHKEVKIKEEAEKLAKAIKSSKIKVAAKVGENGKIFGSITNIQLTDALKDAGFALDRKNININETNIKSVGKYSADIKIHKDITVKIDFEVAEG
jgi:large subunit ribosomal protein L9